MIDPVRGQKNAFFIFAATLLGLLLLIGTAALLPKDSNFAATTRLVLTVTVMIGVVAGGGTLVWARRCHRDLSMLCRYGSASSAVRDTLSHFRHEKQLARQGRLPALLGSVSLFFLYILAHWPQLSFFAPYRASFGVLSLLVASCAADGGAKSRPCRKRMVSATLSQTADRSSGIPTSASGIAVSEKRDKYRCSQSDKTGPVRDRGF
jgi:hypothetical protein